MATFTLLELRVLEQLITVGNSVPQSELIKLCHTNHTLIKPALESLEKKGLINIHAYGNKPRKLYIIKVNLENKRVQAFKTWYIEE